MKDFFKRIFRSFYFKEERIWKQIFADNKLRRIFIFVLLMLVLISVVLLFNMIKVMDAKQSDNQEFYYRMLWIFNLVSASVFAIIISIVFFHLLQGWRLKHFGSRILLKIAVIFALVGVLPGLAIYFIANQFVTRSIDSWFEIEMAPSLDSAVSLGQISLKFFEEESLYQIEILQDQLSTYSNSELLTGLNQIRRQLHLQQLEVWNNAGMLLGFVHDAKQGEVNIPRQIDLQQWQEETRSKIVGISKENASPARVEVYFRIGSVLSNYQSALYFKGARIIPPKLLEDALSVQEAQRNYQELVLARNGLKQMYVGVLTLSLFLSVFVALVLALLLGNSLARPLLWLAEGMQRVMQGDLQEQKALTTKDELSALTRSFSSMTVQLKEARQKVELGVQNEQRARENLQIIMDNLSSGVIVMDKNFLITDFNPATQRILQQPIPEYLNKPITNLPELHELTQAIINNFNEFSSKLAKGLVVERWQDSLQMSSSCEGAKLSIKNIVLCGAKLPDGRWLLVFEDITKEVAAQRIQAWSEVARRLAHEIKNPLTPIRLSAERLQIKLQNSLQGVEQKLLNKSVNTIVDQVDSMILLVNEFRDYARLPTAKLELMDLNELIKDVLLMYLADKEKIEIQSKLSKQKTTILGDPKQLRQVIHNLIQNAQDSALNNVVKLPKIFLSTEVFLQQAEVKLTIEDNGAGFSDLVLGRVFEPYITTKVKGTGLGLSVVKKILDEHSAKIEIRNRVEEGRILGAQIEIVFAAQLNV